MSTSSGSSISVEVEQQRPKNNRKEKKSQPQQQSAVCAGEEVSLLLKVFALLLLLVLGTSALTSPITGRNSWTWTPRGQAPEELLPYEPPAELMHNMSDGELFRMALEVSRKNRLRYRLTPKVAFLFLTRGPLPLSPLWEKYFEGNDGRFSIYIHSHPAHRPENSSSGSVFHKRQVPSKALRWGSMSVVDAERRLLANALLDLSNERFILLSEACIPLFNFNFTYKYLMESRYSFVDVFDNPRPDARGRYNQKLQPEINVTEWRKGAQWFEMSRAIAALIVNETKYYAKFEAIRKELLIPDEHYIPTVLYILVPHFLAFRTLTWTRWIGGSHPVAFRKEDISDEFFKKINLDSNCTHNDQPLKTCYLFARKFAPSALEALMKLAPTSLGFG